MDYIKVRKWLRFCEEEGISADEAVLLITFYIRNLTACSFVGLDPDFEGPLGPVIKDDSK